MTMILLRTTILILCCLSESQWHLAEARREDAPPPPSSFGLTELVLPEKADIENNGYSSLDPPKKQNDFSLYAPTEFSKESSDNHKLLPPPSMMIKGTDSESTSTSSSNGRNKIGNKMNITSKC